MKTKDLRIGNLVKFYPINGTNIYEVFAINKEGYVSLNNNGQIASCSVKDIKPIKLTEEVLVKIGFKKEEKMHSILYYLDYEINEDENIMVRYVIYNSKALPSLRIISPSPIVYVNYELIKRGIKYLHELQNAYYCLTGQELEVNL